MSKSDDQYQAEMEGQAQEAEAAQAQADEAEANNMGGGTAVPAKHSPGPWTAEHVRRNHWGINGPESMLDETHRTQVIAEIQDQVGYLPAAENRANAKLIAAAPDLLEALKTLLAAWCLNDYAAEHGEHADMARAAIAKAINPTPRA